MTHPVLDMRARVGLRTLRDHAFELFVLLPILAFFFFLNAERFLVPAQRHGLLQPLVAHLDLLALIFLLGLTFLLVRRELGLRGGLRVFGASLQALPLSTHAEKTLPRVVAAILLAPWLMVTLALVAFQSTPTTVLGRVGETLLLFLAAFALAAWGPRRASDQNHDGAAEVRPWHAGSWLGRFGGKERRLRALFARDLAMVGRSFSPVATNLALQLLLWSTLAAGIGSGIGRLDLWLSATTWLSTLLALALGNWLLHSQLARPNLELDLGIEPNLLLRSKLRLARFLALPSIVVGCSLTGITLIDDPTRCALSLFQQVAGAHILTTLVTLLAFETPRQPLLSLAFGTFAGLAVPALLLVAPEQSWLWIMMYLLGAAQLRVRVLERIQRLALPL